MSTSAILDQARRLAEDDFSTDKAIALALIAIAEELKQTNWVLDLILQQTQIGVNVFKRE